MQTNDAACFRCFRLVTWEGAGEEGWSGCTGQVTGPNTSGLQIKGKERRGESTRTLHDEAYKYDTEIVKVDDGSSR